MLLKQRLTGAVVLISFVVIFIPMLLSGKGETYFAQTKTNIPSLPTYEFPTESPEMVSQNQLPKAKVLSALNIDVHPLKGQLAEETQSGPIKPIIQIPQGSIDNSQPAIKQQISSFGKGLGTDGAILNKDTIGSNVTKAAKFGSKGWIVQVGSFKIEKNARRLNSNLLEMGYSSFIKPLDAKNGMIYRVRVGPEFSQVQAEKLQEILDKKVKLKGLVMRD